MFKASLLVLALCLQVRADYYWTGAGTDTDWGNPANWSVGSDGAWAFGGSDTYSAPIGKDASVTISDSYTIAKWLGIANSIDGGVSGSVTLKAASPSCGIKSATDNWIVGWGKYSGNLTIDGGTHTIATGGFLVPNGGTVATVTLQNGATVNVNALSRFPNNNASGIGSLIVKDTSKFVGPTENKGIVIGHVGTGHAVIQDSAQLSGWWINVGDGASTAKGYLTIKDNAKVVLLAEPHIGSKGYGELNMQGGTLSCGVRSDLPGKLIIGVSDGKGVVNMTGGSITITELWFSHNTSTSLFNLNGGVVSLNLMKTSGTGTATFNWDGGMLKARKAGEIIASSVPVTLGAKGGLIDPNGFEVSIAAALSGKNPLCLVPGSGKVTLPASTVLDIAFSVPAATPDGTYAVPSVVSDGGTLTYRTTTPDGMFNVVWSEDKSKVTITATPQNLTHITLTSDMKLTEASDWADMFLSMNTCIIDLNGYDLTLGGWVAGTGAMITNSSTTPATLSIATTAEQKSGVGNCNFGGNLTVKVCGSNTTTFGPSLVNTHTGGWIFEGNDPAVQIKYHSAQMGKGKVVFNGNGGFSTYYDASDDSNWIEENVKREVEVNGVGNTFNVAMNHRYNQFMRFTKLTGSGELTLRRGERATIAEIAGDTMDWSAFEGKIILSGGHEPFMWHPNEGDLKKMSFVVDSSAKNGIKFRQWPRTYHIGDISTSSGIYNHNPCISMSDARYTNTVYVGYLNKSSTFAGVFWDHLNFVKVGTGTWTLNVVFGNGNHIMTVREGRINFVSEKISIPSVQWVVEANGTLGGTGTFGGPLTVAGKITDSLTATNSVTFNSGAVLEVKVANDGTLNRLSLTDKRGPVDVSKLKVSVLNAEMLERNSGCEYVVLTAAGGFSGKPKFADGSATLVQKNGDRWRLAISGDGKSIQIKECVGFSVIIR